MSVVFHFYVNTSYHKLLLTRDEDEYEFELDSRACGDMPSDFTEYYDLTTLTEVT